MAFVDEKYKDCNPETTVKRIRKILDDMQIKVNEYWNESGLENCHSLRLTVADSAIGANGKGVTHDFAAASAYGEFVERFQSGLFLYKFQSIRRDPAMNLHLYAPDSVYMTVEELEKEDWIGTHFVR